MYIQSKLTKASLFVQDKKELGEGENGVLAMTSVLKENCDNKS